MKRFIASIKDKVKNWGFDDGDSDEFEEEYLELDNKKIVLKPIWKWLLS